MPRAKRRGCPRRQPLSFFKMSARLLILPPRRARDHTPLCSQLLMVRLYVRMTTGWKGNLGLPAGALLEGSLLKKDINWYLNLPLETCIQLNIEAQHMANLFCYGETLLSQRHIDAEKKHEETLGRRNETIKKLKSERYATLSSKKSAEHKRKAEQRS